jgi:5'-deoxynucleotidase YfbR-like HD superfamily hydrolase
MLDDRLLPPQPLGTEYAIPVQDQKRTTPMNRDFQNAWIETYSGKPFWPLEPDAADVNIHDIAHALSMNCRFCGHVKHHFSIAQHSVIMTLAAGLEHPFAIDILLHDVDEAYFPDIPSPYKDRVFVNMGDNDHVSVSEIGKQIRKAVYIRYGLFHEVTTDIKQIIRSLDLQALAREHKDLMPFGKHWPTLNNVHPFRNPIQKWTPDEAKEHFLQLFRILCPGFATNLSSGN